ncbi:MAG: HAD family hydrolase [Armatimonadetes bacterium]|nr:HAD family hydrolase [Armatimonadota bacterium]
MDAPPPLLIFDFDNTLVDSRIDFTAIRGALIDLLESAGPLPEPRRALMRVPIADLVTRIGDLAPHLTARAWTAIEAFEAAGLADAVPVPNVHGVLAGLAARGFHLALLTNNARTATQRVLDELGLSALISVTVTRDEVPALKPDPAGIRFVMERAGPHRTTYLVGDSWIDGQAAARAGIRFVGFGPRRTEVEARGIMPWAWITDLRELLDLDWNA